MSFDNGCTYYWRHDLEGIIEAKTSVEKMAPRLILEAIKQECSVGQRESTSLDTFSLKAYRKTTIQLHA